MNRILIILFTFPFLFLVSINSPSVYGGTYDTYFDWPMGTMVGQELVLGQGVCVMQNFRNSNPRYDGKQHAGIDLYLDGGVDETADAPVYAVANGIVRNIDTESWGGTYGDGTVVVIEHRLIGAEPVYSMYGHLAEVFVSEGEPVCRGDQVGTILYQRDNSHLHFEIREFACWEEDGCAGPGYKPHGDGELADYGWLDPIGFLYANHLPYPRAIVVNEYIPNLAPGDHWRRNRIAVYPEPNFEGGPLALLAGESIVTALGFQWVVDSQNRPQLWYHVKYDGVNLGYILGLYTIGWGGDVRVGEPLGLWIPPQSKPLIEYRFSISDTNRRYVRNWGRLGFRANGEIHSGAYGVPGVSQPDDPDDYALMFDGATAFLEVGNSDRLRFLRGVAAEAFIARDSNEGEDAIVTKWYGTDQWLLTVYPDRKGKLIFTVRLRDETYATVDYMIPDSRYRRNWVHVAASYSPWDGLRLYWDEELVAQKIAADLEAEGHRLRDRFIISGNNYIHVGDANNEWSRFLGRIDNVKIWGTGGVTRPLKRNRGSRWYR